MNFTGPSEDRLAIRELCDQYVAAVLTKDLMMFGETFAENAERARLGGITKGRAAIVTETAKNMENFAIATMTCSLGNTHVKGQLGTGRCFQTEILFFGDKPECFLGYYDDEYVKAGDRWYFHKRSFTLLNRTKLAAGI